MCAGAPNVGNAFKEIVGTSITYTCQTGYTTMANGLVTVTLACECNNNWQNVSTLLGNCTGN